VTRDNCLVLAAEGAAVKVAVIDFSVFPMRLVRSCRGARTLVLEVSYWIDTKAMVLKAKRAYRD
jgi:hypothetical protein